MTTVTTQNPVRSDLAGTPAGPADRTSSRSRLWAVAGIGAALAGMATIVTSSAVDVVYRDEFAGTKVLHLPMQSIVRIEEVERKGQSVIRDAESGERVVTPFPLPAKPR